MRTLFLSCLALITACSGGDDDKDTTTTDVGDDDDDDTVGGDDDDDDTAAAGGFDIQATALDVSTNAPATEGLCVDLIDPGPALTGGAPIVMMSSTVGAGGAILFEDVPSQSTVGLLVSVKDCGTLNETTYTSATGIQQTDLDGLGDGDVLDGVVAFVIPMPLLVGLQQSAELVGYTGDLETEGLMFGFTLNGGTVAPIGGATVSCASCGPTYYLDADPTDGLLGSATSGANTATDAAAGAAWMIPAGPIGLYNADDGGAHTWTEQLNGSNPGSATCTAIFGM
jgi:hypothetical protein